MALNLTRKLRNDICSTVSVKDAVKNFVLKVYSGTVPNSAESALSGNTLLVKYTNGETFPTDTLVLVYDTVNNALVLDAGQTLTGTAVETGAATFFRLELDSDTGVSDLVDMTRARIQGTVGAVSADLFMGNPSITSGNAKVIGGFALQLLTY